MDPNVDFEKESRNVRGRGTGSIIKGRFEAIQLQYGEEEAQQVKTELYKDSSRSIISYNDSPDVGFNATINAYRGCEHGCIYCYARPTHEYLGLSSGLDFEMKIMAKLDAPELLKKALAARSYVPQSLGMSGVTDCYQPFEKRLELTRGCLEVLADFRNPVVIITKNYLVTRDIDILKILAAYQAAHVIISITTLDEALARNLEPRASTPMRRLDAIERLREAGIPVSVNMAPIIPGLTDHEIPAILKAAKERGAVSAHYTMVRLPYAVKDLFGAWLREHYPTKEAKVLNKIKEMRGGALNSAQFGERMRGQGPYAEHIAMMFKRYRDLYDLNGFTALSAAHFRRNNNGEQLGLIF